MHKMTLNFKQKKIMAIVDGTELKPIAPTTTYIVARVQVLLATSPSNIVKWEEQDTLVIFINNCLNIVSSCMFNLKLLRKNMSKIDNYVQVQRCNNQDVFKK